MTKKVIIGAAIILLLLVVAPIITVLFFLNPVVEKLKPTIAQSISGALGVPVEIGPISASAFPSAKLSVKDLRVGSAVALETLSAQTTLGELIRGNIFVQEIEVADGSATVVRKPDGSVSIGEIALVKSAKAHGGGNGKGSVKQKGDAPAGKAVRYEIDRVRFSNLKAEIIDQTVAPEHRVMIQNLTGSAANIGGSKPAEIDVEASLLGTTPKNFRAQGTGIIPTLSANMPNLNGNVSIRDLNLQQVSDALRIYGAGLPGLALEGTLSAAGSVKTAEEALTFTLKTDAVGTTVAYDDKFQKKAGDAMLVNVGGKFAPPKSVNLDSFSVTLGSLSASGSAKVGRHLDALTLRSENMALGELSRFIPMLQSHKLGGSLTLDLAAAGQPIILSGTVALHKVSGETGGTPFSDLDGTFTLKDRLIRTDKLQGIIRGIPLSATVEIKQLPERIELLPSVLQAFGGKATLQGQLERDGERGFAFNVRADGVDLKQLQNVVPKLPVTGTLKTLSAGMRGNSASPGTTLNGTFSILAENGEIEGINVLGEVLRRVGEIPGVKAKIVESVPEEYREVLNSDTTKYDSLSVDGSLTGSVLAISRATLEHSAYRIAGGGNIILGGDMTLKTRLELTPKLAKRMVEREKNLKYLLDPAGNIVIPVVISRTGGSTVVLPDASVLIENAATSAAKDSAKKALDKITPGLGGALDSLFR